MENGKAILKLYFGLTMSDGTREGRFDKNSETNQGKQRYYAARDKIDRFINTTLSNPDLFNFIRYGGYNNLVKDEFEAQKLIRYVEEKNIGHAFIEPVDCMHGALRFYRKIMLPNWIKDRQNDLIAILKESDFKPHDEAIQRIKDAMKDTSEEAKYWNKLMQKELDKIDKDRLWKLNLEFF